MKNNNFKYFDTTADIGIEVQAENISKAYTDCGLATLNLITDIEKIRPQISKKIHMESEDEYGLLYDWITELLVLLDSENYMTSRYDIAITQKDDIFILDGIIMGDIYNTDIYNYKTEVKAITYHKMEIENKNGVYFIRFIVDL